MREPSRAPSSHHGTIAARVERFLKRKQSLGFRMETQAILLRQFSRFASRHSLRGPIKAHDLVAWATEGASHTRGYRANRLSAVRSFARHCAAEDGASEVPPARLLSSARHRNQPHVFPPKDVVALMAAAGRLARVYPHRPLVYQTLIGLLASTGMRISEALGLTLDDVNLGQSLIVVRLTKFGKTRLVPLHPTTRQALRAYMRWRNPNGHARVDEALLVGAKGSALPYTTVLHTFRLLVGQLGLQSNGTLASVRLHDLRHTFACRRLLQWYHEGVDVNHAITSLSTYLGHGKVSDTYWYLTGTGDLLATVAARFEQFASSDPRAVGRRQAHEG